MKKVWFVTGASRGLGLEVAKAALASGGAVVATARSVADVTRAMGANSEVLHALALDVTDSAAAERAISHAVERFGRIDVLVNNAAQAHLGWFEAIDQQNVRRNFDVNVFGAMHVVRAALPRLRTQRAGLIVTISSVNGLVANAGGSLYSATKFALEGWMEGLAQEVAPLGIKSLIIEPGMMRTDFLDGRSMQMAARDIPDYAKAVAEFRGFITQANHNQPGSPAELARRIVVLADDTDPPARYVFGDDAITWATAKVDALAKHIADSRERDFRTR